MQLSELIVFNCVSCAHFSPVKSALKPFSTAPLGGYARYAPVRPRF